MGCLQAKPNEAPVSSPANGASKLRVPLLGSVDWVPPEDAPTAEENGFNASYEVFLAPEPTAAPPIPRTTILDRVKLVYASEVRALLPVASGLEPPASRRRSSVRGWKSSGAVFAAAREQAHSHPQHDYSSKLLASFQRLLEFPVIGPVDQRARVAGVQRLQAEFGAAALSTIAIIVKEVGLENEHRSIPALPLQDPSDITVYACKGAQTAHSLQLFYFI